MKDARELFVYICEEEPMNPVGGTLWIRKNDATSGLELYVFIIPLPWFADPNPRWVIEETSTFPPHAPLTSIEEIANEIKVKEQLGGLMGGPLKYIPVRSNDEAIAYANNIGGAND